MDVIIGSFQSPGPGRRRNAAGGLVFRTIVHAIDGRRCLREDHQLPAVRHGSAREVAAVVDQSYASGENGSDYPCVGVVSRRLCVGHPSSSRRGVKQATVGGGARDFFVLVCMHTDELSISVWHKDIYTNTQGRAARVHTRAVFPAHREWPHGSRWCRVERVMRCPLHTAPPKKPRADASGIGGYGTTHSRRI